MNFREFVVNEGFFDTWGMDPYLKAIYKNADPEAKKAIMDIKNGLQISLADAIKKYVSDHSQPQQKLQQYWQHVGPQRDASGVKAAPQTYGLEMGKRNW